MHRSHLASELSATVRWLQGEIFLVVLVGILGKELIVSMVPKVVLKW